MSFIADLLDAEGYESYCSLGYRVNAGDIQVIQPDFILLELHHNDSDATLMLLNQLRQFPATRTTPIMVSSTDKGLLENLATPLHELGCTTLVKPFDLDQLLVGIGRACIHNYRTNRYDTTQRPLSSSDLFMN